MTKIKNYVEMIEDELCSAKEYAEKSIELKSEGLTQWSQKFKEMSIQELQHAINIHDYAVLEIEELNKVYKPTNEMQEKWDKSHKEFVEKAAWIKQMQAM